MTNCKVIVLLLLFLSIRLSENSECPKKPIKYEFAYWVNFTSNLTQQINEVITADVKGYYFNITDTLPILCKGILNISHDTAHLWIYYAQLKEIQPGAFDNQNLTAQLSLEGNELTVIRTGTFKGLRVTDLSLYRNKITHIEPEAFADLPNLSIVYLTQNRIAEFHHNSFTNTPSVLSFDMSFNNLTKIGEKWLSFMTKEKAVGIGISSNQIGEIHPKAFEHIDVWNLNLDNNQLTTIPDEVFTNNSLKMLNFTNNKLESIQDAFFAQEHLYRADLRGNKLNCGVQRKLKEFEEVKPTAVITYDKKNCL